jgi:hypothetical protein
MKMGASKFIVTPFFGLNFPLYGPRNLKICGVFAKNRFLPEWASWFIREVNPEGVFSKKACHWQP